MEWRKNLYHLEEQPPEQSWELISKELEDDIPALRMKLYDLSTEPPEGTWDAVESKLDPTEKKRPEAPVIWYRKSWNLAAAAIFAVVLFGVVYINFNKLNPTDISTAVINPLPASQTDGPNPESVIESVVNLPAEEASLKDNNYIYFTSVNGDTRRLSYKLKPFLPALKNKRHHAVLDKWSSQLEKSSFVPSGNNFFDIMEMVQLVEQKSR